MYFFFIGCTVTLVVLFDSWNVGRERDMSAGEEIYFKVFFINL